MKVIGVGQITLLYRIPIGDIVNQMVEDRKTVDVTVKIPVTGPVSIGMIDLVPT